MPAAFRRLLASEPSSGLVLTALDQCLAAYPRNEWATVAHRLRALPSFNKSVKAITRLLASRAVDCDLDSQGRILIPPMLRETASLETEAVIVGVLDRFELWAPPVWDAFIKESERWLEQEESELPWPPATTPVPPSSTRKA